MAEQTETCVTSNAVVAKTASDYGGGVDCTERGSDGEESRGRDKHIETAKRLRGTC